MERERPVTYLQFHVVFTVPWVLLLGWLSFRAMRAGEPVAGRLGGGNRLAWLTLAAHVVVALLYTTPWDNYLVARGIWGYPEGRVWFTLGWVPIEEYLFFVLQTTATTLALFALARTTMGGSPGNASGTPSPERAGASGGNARSVALRVAGAVFFLALAGGGAVALGFERGTYLGLILVWAAPVLALQWSFGGDLIAGRWRIVAPAVALPTLWLWLADRIAIGLEIWWIADAYTTGMSIFGLPIEEATFFAVTNLLVVFGVTLVLHPASWPRWHRLRAAVAAARGLGWKAVFVLWALSMVPVPLWPAAFPTFAYASTALLALGTLLYARDRFGWRAYLMFAVAFAFGVAVELLGSRTGIPFGHYDYHAPGPAILGVPLLVPLGWWAFTLVALAAAAMRATVAVAPLVLVAWDLGLDPLMVRHEFWRFDPPGAYAGVPWTNFVGWYLAGAVLVWMLLRIEPRVKQLAGGPLRAVFIAQAFFLVFGLAYFGLWTPALVTACAMGGVGLSWRWPRAEAPGMRAVE